MAEKTAKGTQVKAALKQASKEKSSEIAFDGDIRVRITRKIRSALGAFDEGDIVSLPGGIARVFIGDGRAVKAEA